MIIAKNENSVLKVNTNVEDNILTINYEKGFLSHIDSFLNEFNNMPWDEKVEKIFGENFNEENIDENVNTIKKYIADKTTSKDCKFEDLVFETESENNIDSYQGESLNLAKNLSYFANIKLPNEVLEIVNESIFKLKEISIEDIDFVDSNGWVNSYVIYLGPSVKYKGCIGKIVRQRDDEASELVEFPKKYKENGGVARFWCNLSNLKALS